MSFLGSKLNDFSKKVYFINDEGQLEVNNRMLEAFDTFQVLNISNGLSNYIHLEKRKPQGTETESPTFQLRADVIASGINVNRLGTVQSEYSGAGTLITPAGTFTNVIRIKSTQTITDTVPGMGNHSTIVAYNWYKAGVNHELANVTEVTSSSSSQSAYYTSVPLNLGLEENELINLLVFPNPATNRIHINSDEVISKVEVYQLSGELALEQTANATALEIDLTALNTGMYLVKVTGQNGAVSVKRITKN